MQQGCRAFIFSGEGGGDLIRECYTMQTSWMLEVFQYYFKKVADECLNAVPGFVSNCYQSYGHDSAGFNLRDPHKILASCELVPKEEDYHERCVVGGVHVILDFWGPSLQNQVDEFCALLEEGSTKEYCQTLVSDRKADLSL